METVVALHASAGIGLPIELHYLLVIANGLVDFKAANGPDE
jgi:hypothetical protein